MQFKDILKSTESEGKEKHVPIIEIGKGKGEGGADWWQRSKTEPNAVLK